MHKKKNEHKKRNKSTRQNTYKISVGKKTKISKKKKKKNPWSINENQPIKTINVLMESDIFKR